MKKSFTLLSLLVVIVMMISACSTAATPAPAEPAAPAATTAPAAATEAPAAPTEAAMSEGSIAVLLPDSASSARWEADDRRFFEEAFKAAGVDYTIVNAEGDARMQQTQAEQAITNGAKVLLLVNLDSGSGAAIIAQAREAGVKVIDYDRLTIEGPGADVYVSFDNVSVGRLMGETLEPLIDGLDADPKQVVQLNGSPTDNNATLFREGYYGVAKPHYDAGDWALVADQAVPDWDNQQALTIYEQILTAAGGNVDATFAANDGLAGSVIAALKAQGADPIPVSGQDATVGGIQNILSGWQSMTVYKPIKLEADAAAQAAIALLKGEDVSTLTADTINNGTSDLPFMKLTPLAVTADNIADTVIADGFRTWDEICVGDFAQYCPPEATGGAAMTEPAPVCDATGSIAVLLPDSASSARWEADDRRFFEEAFKAAGVDYTIVNAEGDARMQQTQAEQAITNGAKVLLLVNLDSGSGAAIIAQAREAGVKVIDYDRLTIEGPGADVYVSFDNVSVGRLMGETLEPLIDGLDADPKQVVQLNGSPTDNNATLFREGYYGVAKPHYDAGDWALVADQAVPDWDNQQALTIYEQILTAAGGNVDATFAANDGLAGSVIAALKAQGADPIPVSGQDATVGGIQNILSGWQSMTVYKPIKLEADAASQAAIALLCGDDVSTLTADTINNGTNDLPFMKLTPLAVTADNIADTVIADGFRTWDEICVGDFEQYCPTNR
ncbi:MAG: substrate-binding domain-containing protein [Anaerolineales bacterium]|nr:substrate-binding domain-containing protein [Anaerolineales bacterium]MCB9142329.1 substrate-binding domain-containing protein [Anaerolineales bacterium]